MEIRNSIYFPLVCALALSASSCIRDEILSCPPLSVRVEVTDKNYFNVHETALEEPVDENLPFAGYISSLRYTLKNIATGDVVERKDVRNFTSGEKLFRIDFCDTLPHGTYVLTVFADGRTEKPLMFDETKYQISVSYDLYITEKPLMFDETGENLKLHPDSSEGGDTYLTTDTLVYDAWSYDYAVGLERVKGKLLVLMENLPSDCAVADHSVKGLYDHVTPSFIYKGQSAVMKSLSVSEQDHASVLSGTLLSPSAGGGESVFSLSLKDNAGSVLPGPHDSAVKVSIRRNELTLLRYSYGSGGKLVISLYVNDHWEVVHGMEID
mgnify:FL=1